MKREYCNRRPGIACGHTPTTLNWTWQPVSRVIADAEIAALKQRVAELERELEAGDTKYHELEKNQWGTQMLLDSRDAEIAAVTKELEAARKVMHYDEALLKEFVRPTCLMHAAMIDNRERALAAYRATQTKEPRDEKAE